MGKVGKSILAALGLIILASVTLAGFGLYKYGPRLGIWFPSPSPERYGNELLSWMESGVYADGPKWAEAKRAAAKGIKDAKSLQETETVINKALKVAGGKHSFILTKDMQKESENSYTAPTVKVEGKIATATLPETMGTPEQETDYAKKLATGLASAQNICGAVVDLRDNFGGSMYPMISGVSALLPEGKLSSFTDAAATDLYLADGNIHLGSKDGNSPTSFKIPTRKLKVPVAILTDGRTASSAEQTLIAFKGLDYTRTFGEPTAGYASVNSSYKLPTGSLMQLTTGFTKDRAGNLYKEQPIKADVPTTAEQAPKAATEWLAKMGCR